MKDFIRAMVVPFFMLLFPAVWYINRNVMTEQLPPYIEPTTGLVALSIGGAVFSSALFATVFALIQRQTHEGTGQASPYRQRIVQPDTTALRVFFGFISVYFGVALVEIGGIGPSWLGELLYIALVPLGVPLLVLIPFAIHFHWALILGLVLCVLWMSLLSTIISDIVHSQSLLITNE